MTYQKILHYQVNIWYILAHKDSISFRIVSDPGERGHISFAVTSASKIYNEKPQWVG
jgi:hypothetical protein